jgi:hypothetical protein
MDIARPGRAKRYKYVRGRTLIVLRSFALP